MSADVQRWNLTKGLDELGWQMSGHPDGEWVKFTDHVAAVQAACNEGDSRFAALLADSTALLVSGEDIWNAAIGAAERFTGFDLTALRKPVQP